jgi:hypothetical protein
MLHAKGFSAWVTINGEEALEFDIETSEDEKTMTCWIASEVGKVRLAATVHRWPSGIDTMSKTFAVHWKNLSYYQDTTGNLKMDGNSCGGVVIAKEQRHLTAKKVGVTDGMNLKPFMFSPLELTGTTFFYSCLFVPLYLLLCALDDDAFLGSGPSHQDLGLIELCIHPVKIGKTNVSSKSTQALSGIKVHERSKKAVTQQIT